MPTLKTDNPKPSNKDGFLRSILREMLSTSAVLIPMIMLILVFASLISVLWKEEYSSVPILDTRETILLFAVSITFVFTPVIIKLVSVQKKSEQTIETISEVNQKIDHFVLVQFVQAINKDTYEETLRKNYLAITNPYIYYTDLERLSDLYNRIIGYKHLGRVTNRTDQEVKGEVDAGFKGVVSGGLGGKITENREEEFIIREPSIMDMLLEVQTDMLRNNQITLGIERGLSEGQFQTPDSNASDEFESAIIAEKQRLLGLKKKVLVTTNFTLKLSDPGQSHYILSFTRRLVESVEESPAVTFNTLFPRNSLTETEKIIFEKNLDSTIELILLGHITSSKISNDGSISIDIAPYAIYLP